ncbi:AAA family ATPase [Spirulina sp.]|uniref:AAA family ATPase n=1 Tax=Spirulina sp. TaxID=1157 RepID=UPI003F6FA03C
MDSSTLTMSHNEHLNSSSLKKFTINGLFGFKNVEISFEKQSIILIAENGAGKTTILNALYYSISRNFSKLKTIDFDSIILDFESAASVTIKKDELVDDLIEFDILRKYLPTREILSLQRLSERGMSYHYILRRAEMLLTRYTRFSRKEISELLESHFTNDSGVIEKENSTTRENANECVLYFPTYRRIEEDLNSLGYQNDEFNESFLGKEESLIQFGMNDVVEKIDKITQEIKDSALNLFSKVTGEMLTQFVDNEAVTLEMRQSLKPDTLKIILGRVGEKNISKENRKKIEDLVNSERINNSENNQLVYFLFKLLSLYEQQKRKDESIKNFVEICNQYLSRKKLIYDEVNVKIYITQTEEDRKIKFKYLSSGEKQIISIFSKIYLEENAKDFIVLFDEPELSLSIEWQRLLLPDILRSGKCKLLVAVTHSPFIFDNELNLNAHDLNSFVKE